MGTQIQFFLGPRDLVALGDKLSQFDELVYLRPDLNGITLHAGESIVPRYGTEDLRLYIARKSDIRAWMSHDVNRFASEDLLPATYRPLVEFDRPFVSKNYVRAGRVYRVDSYRLPTGEKVRKSEDWIAWAKEVFFAVRKSLTKVEDTGYYAGEEALAMRSGGVLFQQIDDPRNQFCV